MSVTPRHLAIGILSLFCVATFVVILLDIARGIVTTLTYIDAFALLIFVGLLWAAWRGWAYIGHIIVGFITLLAASALDEPFLTQQFSGVVLIPAMVALVLTNARWILGSAVVILALLIARAGGQSIYLEPINFIIYVICIGSLLLARLVAVGAMQRAEQAQAEAAAAAAALQTANTSLEARVAERTAALQVALDEVQARAAEQARLLAENQQQRDVIREMSVPVLPLSAQALVLPLIGALDSERLRQVQQQALTHIEQTAARHLILDITGVMLVDTQVAKGLLQVVQAAQLLGTEVILVGIRPEVAQTIVGLGMPLEGVTICSTLQAGIAYTLGLAGG